MLDCRFDVRITIPRNNSRRCRRYDIESAVMHNSALRTIASLRNPPTLLPFHTNLESANLKTLPEPNSDDHLRNNGI